MDEKWKKILEVYEDSVINEGLSFDKRPFGSFISKLESMIDKKYSDDKTKQKKYIQIVMEIDDDWEKLLRKIRSLEKAL